MAIHLGYIRPVITLERDRSATQGLLFNEFAHVALQCIVFNVEQWVGGGGGSSYKYIFNVPRSERWLFFNHGTRGSRDRRNCAGRY